MNMARVKIFGTAILTLAIILAGCNPDVSNIKMRRGYNAKPVGSGGPPVTNQTLNAPTGVNTTQLSSGKIRISWDAVPGATGYRVYYGDPNDNKMRYYVEIPAPATSWEDNDALNSGHTYYYQVQAINAGGEGPVSSVTQQAYTSTPTVSNPFIGTWRLSHSSRPVILSTETAVFTDHSVSLYYPYPGGPATGSYTYSGNHANITVSWVDGSYSDELSFTADITGSNSLRIWWFDDLYSDFTR